MVELVWTKEWPVEPGWYWMRCRQQGFDWHQPVIERIHQAADTSKFQVSFWKKFEFEWCRIPEPVEKGGTNGSR